jgi:hypothetical protein
MFALTMTGMAILLGPAAARERLMCPMIYEPVCAKTRAGHLKTFPSDCEARNAHARIRYRGECRARHR